MNLSGSRKQTGEKSFSHPIEFIVELCLRFAHPINRTLFYGYITHGKAQHSESQVTKPNPPISQPAAKPTAEDSITRLRQAKQSLDDAQTALGRSAKLTRSAHTDKTSVVPARRRNDVEYSTNETSSPSTSNTGTTTQGAGFGDQYSSSAPNTATTIQSSADQRSTRSSSTLNVGATVQDPGVEQAPNSDPSGPSVDNGGKANADNEVRPATRKDKKKGGKRKRKDSEVEDGDYSDNDNTEEHEVEQIVGFRKGQVCHLIACII
jgi:hypothetical protein